MYFGFDVPFHKGRDQTRLPLSQRRTLLREVIRPRDSIEIAEWTAELENLESFVNEWKLEGIVAKHIDRCTAAAISSGARCDRTTILVSESLCWRKEKNMAGF
jgi:hypothetical protein